MQRHAGAARERRVAQRVQRIAHGGLFGERHEARPCGGGDGDEDAGKAYQRFDHARLRPSVSRAT